MDPVRLPDVGDRFLESWAIEAQVGKGGFSIVYRARHDDGRVAAVKILTPESASKVTSKSYDAEIADRFLREARLLDQLDSAYTIRLWEYGESEEGLLYMVFEYIDGRMLFDEIKRVGALEHDRVIHVLRQTLIGLESAHALGILHRDIKPNNIMLYEFEGDADRVKLVDFGIAKSFDEDKALPGNDLTAAGLLVGTPRYMAPEQLRGLDLNQAADLYSLGLCAIEMLSGRKCIPGKDRVKIVEYQLGPHQVVIPDDVSVDPALAGIVHRLTEKRLADRYKTATEALRDLEALAGDPGATGDTVFQQIPDLDELLGKPADENDDTVFETVNTAELAALIEEQRKAAALSAENPVPDSIDPFGETVASRALVTPELKAAIEDLRANDSTVELGHLNTEALPSPYGEPEPSGFQASFDQKYGGGGIPAVQAVQADNSYGSGQFQQPAPADASNSYGSGQFQPPQPTGQPYGSGTYPQPPPAQQSYGSGQFQQPPGLGHPPHGHPLPPQPGQPHGAAPYGSGQYAQPPLGAYGSGQFQQPPDMYGSGQFPQPGFGLPPGQFPPGHPAHQPPGPYNQGPPVPQLTSDDKLALGAAAIVPGVGHIIAGQVAKGAIIMVLLLLLVVFASPLLWLVFAPLALVDTFLLVRAQKRRPVGKFEFLPDLRHLL